MARQEVDIGVVGNDGTGDSIREAFRKVNDNFKEIYAVFNQGDTIGFKDLSDVTVNNQNTIISTINTGTGIRLVDRVLDGGTSISVQYTEDKINIRAIGTSLDSDETPQLAGPLNAKGFPIANVASPNALAVDIFNSVHPEDPIGINDIVITKGYGDQNYIRKSGGSSSISGQIRVRDEPTNINAYTLEVTNSVSNNAVVVGHGFDTAFDGASYVYYSGGVPAAGLIPIIDVTNSTYFIIGRSFRIEELGNTDFTLLGALRNRVGEIFTLTNTSSLVGFGSNVPVEGGGPTSITTEIIDGGTPGTTIFANTIDGGSSSITSGSSTGKVKPVYFLKYVNANQLSVHPTFIDAINGSNKLNFSGYTGFQQFRDAFYNPNLEGNWLSNEVLPRKSTLRRQGDKMEGTLMLHDHPFPLQGVGTPNNPDDLQAATKYYVDNSSFASTVNLYVSTNGNDNQTDTPIGKEGRAWAYAFKSVGKACEVAEHMMNNAALEPGPYRQLISFSRIVSGVTQTDLSIVTEFTPPSSNGLARVKFSNNNGGPVDQGNSPTIEIIPGKLVRGRISGATGIIYDYATEPNADYVDLQQIKGEFLLGENIEFGDPVKSLHITIHIESGIYEEDYPIKVPSNTALVGDEFRRVLIRPHDRISQSPWIYTWFFRNSEFDSLGIATGGTEFEPNLIGWYGYHYLKQPNKPIDRGLIYTNLGSYTTQANAILAAKTAIQNAVIDEIESSGPLLTTIEAAKSQRDTGYIVDAIAYDLEHGGIKKIYDIQESYYGVTLSSRCLQGLIYIASYINNTIIPTADLTIKTIISNMINKIVYAFDSDYNTPKNNKDLDVFLCNDSAIIRQITCQGHGGFMMVLDPDGQILTKSPYCQQSGSFAGSINTKSFRGGQYIDGFAGNLTATVIQKITNTQIKISGIPKSPQTPCSFFIDGERYKVDSYVPESGSDVNARDLLIANKLFIQTQCITYLNSSYPGLKYPVEDIIRHINRLIDAITFDVVYGGNSRTLDANRRFFNPGTEELRYSSDVKPLLISMINYVKETSAAVIINQPVTELQTQVSQVKITGRSGTFGSQGNIATLLDNVKTTINNGIDSANSLANPTFVLVLDSLTPLTTNPPKLTLITPGNTSMLSNDYTQVNDLGYGIVTNNNGLSECVSVFSYYCWTGMFSNNGGQIRSLNSSTANGEYGLIAAGSDPLEIPDQVNLVDHSMQVAKIVKRNTGTNNLTNTGLEKALFIYVESYSFLPYNVSIVEINHGPIIGIVRYEMNNIQTIEPGIIRLNFNTAGNNDTSTGGLAADVNDGDKVIIRSGQNFKFNNVLDTNPTRPSTALTFEGDPANDTNAPVYRVISYNIKGPNNQSLPANQSILTFDATYNYIPLIVKKDRLSLVDPNDINKTLGNAAGDLKIAINLITSTISVNRLQTGQMLTAWDGKIHRITSYTAITAQNYAYITISDLDSNGQALQNINTPVISGLQSSLNPSVNLTLNNDNDLILRAGLAKDETANITVRISTMRATGHDFLDVGTGGYNTSNYPSKIYGNPRNPSQAREVEERSRGRVFYVSTDQDGFFRVGRFFTVDQGTGTVTFAASIALSNLDGIGFKRGISISEFSSDDKFVDLAEDAVPTEAAISGYIDRRLGVDRNGFYLDATELYPAAPGFIARNANTPLKGPTSNISWANYRLTDLGMPIADNDAASKNYVDIEVSGYSSLKQLKDVLTTVSSPGEILMFTSTSGEAVASSIGGDLQASVSSTLNSTLNEAIPATGGLTYIKIADASLFPDNGYVLIDLEIFQYSGRTTGSGAEQLDGIIRLSISTDDDLKFRQLNPAAHSVGAIVHSLKFAQLDLQIKSDTIVNADIKSDAAIEQSKLSLNLASASNSAPTGTASNKQAASGLASFDDDNFEVTDGWAKIKNGGIARIEIENIGTNKILGNLDRTTANYPQELTPENILKRASYDAMNSISTIGQDHVFTFRPQSTEALSTFGSNNININVSPNSLVKRTANGHLKITNLDSNGNVSIISISGTVILNVTSYNALTNVFTCDPATLVEGGRINISGNNTGNLQLPNYNNSGTNYFIIETNGSTEFKLSLTLGGTAITTSGSTINGFTFVNATGTADASTPVTYKGQWTPGTSATLRATTANAWHEARTITVTGDAGGTVSLDGSADATLNLNVGYSTSAGSAGYVNNALTFNDGTSGDIPGTLFDGSTARTITYSTLGAPKADGTGASGTWSININGDITTRVITTGAATTTGTITGAWTLTSGSTLQATYADLAEYYTSDRTYESGTVVIFAGTAETTTTEIFADTRVAGVVTTNPAYVMNHQLKDINNSVCIALQGRVPCKVVGKVNKGDLLTTSANAGYAIKAIDPKVGTIIGKALEDKDTNEFGVIEIAVGRC